MGFGKPKTLNVQSSVKALQPVQKRQIPIEFHSHFSKACRLLAEQKEVEAETEFEECAKACPEAWLGVACEDLRDGMKEQALRRFGQVIKHASYHKTLAVALNNCGMLLNNNGCRSSARGFFKRAFEYWKIADIATNIALSAMYHQDMDDANYWINKALLMEPTNSLIRFNAALIQLVCGDFKSGFSNYEARFTNPNGKTRKLSVFRPEWNGRKTDKTLLVYAEQGAGDTIQMLRYGPIIKPLVRKLVLACQVGLKALAERQGCWDEIWEDLPAKIDSAQVPHWDVQLPMMSLPRVLHTTPGTIPQAPYLIAKEESRRGSLDGLHIGFCWAGSLSHSDDIWRSTRFEDWLPLLQTKDSIFYSFQLGPRTLDKVGMDSPVFVDLSPEIKDYDDSAAWVRRMDLIITVDTSLAHLAGALGIPCWVLIAHSPDWRWMHDRDDSPWYPSIRLFRQEKEGDWAPVFKRIEQELYAIQQTRSHKMGDDVHQLA